MQYEIYIDVFFLVNFMMDYLVLLAVRKILKCTATHGHILLGALAGALGACAVICIPIPPFMKLICLHTLVNSSMTMTGLNIRKMRVFLRAMILVYLISFLLGGIMTWLWQYLAGYMRAGGLFFAVTVCSYFLLSRGMSFLEQFWKVQEYRCTATLYLKDQICEVQAVIDTGNGLYDRLTDKPVHIISKKAMEKLTENEAIQGVRYIPYRTIQKQAAVLPVIKIDRIQIHGAQEKLILAPLLGISEQQFGDGEFDLILHPGDY